MNDVRRHRRVRGLRAATLHNLAQLPDLFRSVRAGLLQRLLFLLIWSVASLASSAAWAATINSLTWTPSQFTYPGTVITFTMGFNTDSFAWNSAAFKDSVPGGVSFNLVSCTPAPNNNTSQTVSCDFTYTTTASDTSTLQFIPQVTVDGKDTAIWSSIAQINYSAPPAAPIALSSSANPSTGGQNVTFTATVSGDGTHGTPTGTVQFTSGSTFNQTVTLSGGKATYSSSALPAGLNAVYAYYSGSAYYSASSTSLTQTVNGTPLSLASTPSSTAKVGQSYSQTNVASGGTSGYSYSLAGGTSAPAGTSLNTSTGTVSGTPTTAGAFSYQVKATDSTSPTAQTVTNTVSGTIAKGDQTISFTSSAPASATVGGATYTPTATSTSGLTVTLTVDASSAGVCSMSGGAISFQAVGTCIIDANQGGNTNYNAASQVQQSVSVGKGSQTISFTSSAPASATVGGATYTPTATSTSGLTVTLTVDSSSAGVCSMSGGAVSFQAVGTCIIDANQGGNTNYNAASQVQQSVSVGKGSQTISFTSSAPASATVGGATYTPTATSTSGLTVTLTVDASSAGVCSMSGGAVSFQAVGTCIIDANQGGNTNYNAASQVQQSVSVGKGSQTISFTSSAPASATVGGATYTPTATSTSGLTVTLTVDASSAGVCSMSGGAVSFQAVGTCIIDANQAGNTNYSAATQLQQSFSVGKGSQTISFTQPPDTALTAGPVTLTATATSGLAVTFTSTTTAVCTVSGNSVTLVSAGTCTIDADQAGDANYTAAPTVTKSFTVGKGTNVITFNALPDRALGSGSFTVSATASSGLTVTFASLTPSTCSLSGTTVSLLAVGQCTIEASQAGDSNYVAAAVVDQGFTISKAVTSVTLQAQSSILYGFPLTLTATVTGVNPTGSVTFLDGGATLATVGLTGGVATFTTKALATGTHNLTARYAGDASNLPTTSSTVTVTVNVRPDPSQDPDVIGLVNAQVSAMQRFGQTQIDNIGDRLTQMHGDNDNGPVSFGVAVNTPQPPQSVAAQQWFADGGATALAYAGGDPSKAPKTDPNPLSAIPAGTAQNVRPLVHIWTAGSVSFGTVNPGGGVDNTFSTPGVTVGIDTRLLDGLKGGIALGYATDRTTIGSNGTRSDGKNLSVALYASYNPFPNAYLDMIGGYGHATFDSLRYSSPGNVFLKGNRGAHEWFGSATASYEHKGDHWMLAPFGRLDAVRMTFDPYSETGSSFWALNFQRMTTSAVRAALGVRVSHDVPVDWGRLKLNANVEDDYRLSGDYSQALGYADLVGGPLYSVAGAATSTNQIAGGLGLSAQIGAVNVDAKYQLSVGSRWKVESQTVSGGIRIAF